MFLLATGVIVAGCGDRASTPTSPSNLAPVASSSIPAQTLTAGGPRGRIDAALYFSDPDDDALTYAATSSDTQVAAVSVSGTTVTVTAANPGQANVTVTARDPANMSATQSFSVTVEAPRPGGACAAGLELSPGQFCSVHIPGIVLSSAQRKRFEILDDGRGCYGDFCAGFGLNLNGFRASKVWGTDRWRIDALP